MIRGIENHRYVTPQVEGRRRRMKPSFVSFILWHIIVLFYVLCEYLCNGETDSKPLLIDLSHEFNKDAIYWVETQPLTVTVTHNGTTDKGYWYQSEEISAGTHGGTHLDAPCHFAKGRWCVSDIPLEKLVVPAAVIDISGEVQANPSIHLTKEHLMSWEKAHGRIPNGCLLLVYTGWSRFWPDPLLYTGTTEKNVSLLKFPAVTPEAAQWLVDNRVIVGLGIDSMSVERPLSPSPRTHQILEEKNIYGIENANNLDHLPPTGATVYVLPMKLKGASGAPCRVLASIPFPQSSSSQCTTHSWYFIVAIIIISSTFIK